MSLKPRIVSHWSLTSNSRRSESDTLNKASTTQQVRRCGDRRDTLIDTYSHAHFLQVWTTRTRRDTY